MAKSTTARTRTAKEESSTPPSTAPAAAKRKRASGSTRSRKLPKAVEGAVRIAQDKKAFDLVVLDLRKADGFTDYFVICSATNKRQISAIADAIREQLKTEFDERPVLAEGTDKSESILIDYFNFVVHVFSRECRAFYDLERLWGSAERHEFSDDKPGDEAPA